MALTPAQAKVADAAMAAVQSAIAQARAAVDGEWSALVWLTGSESAHAARVESLRQSEKIADDLARRRPTLTAAGLIGFVELASAAAEVGSILTEARRVTGAGFVEGVVNPTLDDLNPLNFSGVVGRAVLVLLAAAVVYSIVRK